MHLTSHGYVHRDLKPWNIMLNDDLTVLKIIDFGYATPIDLDELKLSSKYIQGRLNGTRSYAAPELY